MKHEWASWMLGGRVRCGVLLVLRWLASVVVTTCTPIEQLPLLSSCSVELGYFGSLHSPGTATGLTGFQKFYAYGQFSGSLTFVTICYVAPDVTNDRAIVSKVLGQEGEKLEAWHAAYSFDECARARNCDHIQCTGTSLLIFERFASVRVALKFMEDVAESLINKRTRLGPTLMGPVCKPGLDCSVSH